MGLALPSISKTSWPGGVSPLSRNIHRCGMKFLVTPLSGLYNRIFIFSISSSWQCVEHSLETHTHTQPLKATGIRAMQLRSASQIIKSASQIRADYITCVRERTYLSGDSSNFSDN